MKFTAPHFSQELLPPRPSEDSPHPLMPWKAVLRSFPKLLFQYKTLDFSQEFVGGSNAGVSGDFNATLPPLTWH